MPDPVVVRQANEFRAALLRREAAQMQAMAARWLQTERALEHSITALLDEIERRQRAGEQFGRYSGPYTRLERYQELLRQVRSELVKFGVYTEAQVNQGIADHVALGVEHSTAALRQAQGPEPSTGSGAGAQGPEPSTGSGAGAQGPEVVGQFNRLSVPAVESMVGVLQANAPVGQLLADAWPQAAVRMTEALTNGVALGWNPRKTARAMREGLQASALQRALTIARTEQLRAYRTATQENYRASGVVKAYKRLAAKSARTCIACLMADGRVYALEESFEEHPRGRCTLVPVLIGGPEPTWETGKEWFARQPEATQRQILGPAAFDAWREGAVRLEDLVERHEHPVWGGSLGVKSLKRAIGESEAKRYTTPVRSAAGVRSYYEKPDKTKVMGFTWYDVDKSGALPGVGKAIAAGRDKADGWEANERVFKQEYLPRHQVRDDVKRTLGLWDTPEPSFNVWVKGRRDDIVALSKDWGRAYNQQAMAMLLPNQAGEGGALSWDFGRRLTVRELDRVLGGVQQVNQILKAQRDAGGETEISEIGLTILGQRRLEYWVGSKREQEMGRTLVEQALRVAGLPIPDTGWEGGYDFNLLFRDKDY